MTTIRTERLILRPPRMTDVDAYLEFAIDPRFAFFATPVDPTRQLITDFFTRYVNAAPDELLMFVTIHSESDAVIGSVELDFDSPNKVAWLGYALAPRYWSQGFATEAAGAVIAHAFTSTDVEKICARADARNHASLRVLEKLGLQREGLLRKQVIRRGERADRAVYGLLRTEWLART
jgi:RimJ/RimL family protein N-acetyltransferase